MKFSDIEQNGWEELKPYLDTALIPLTGLTGEEQPWEATVKLEQLRDAMDPFEQTYKGRIVTYPAVHYSESDEELKRLVNELCRRMRACGFLHCIVVTADSRFSAMRPEEASLMVAPLVDGQAESESEYRVRIRSLVEELWFGMKG